MTNTDSDTEFPLHLARIADALEKFSPTDPVPADLPDADAYV